MHYDQPIKHFDQCGWHRQLSGSVYAYHPVAQGSIPMHNIYAFFNLQLYCGVGRTKRNKKEAVIDPFQKKFFNQSECLKLARPFLCRIGSFGQKPSNESFHQKQSFLVKIRTGSSQGDCVQSEPVITNGLSGMPQDYSVNKEVIFLNALFPVCFRTKCLLFVNLLFFWVIIVEHRQG